MKTTSKGRPSAGVIIGVLALVLAISGSAIAGVGAARKITKAKVKNIAAKQVQSLAPELNVNSAVTAESAKIATNVLSANVTADGTMLGSIPAGATSAKTALGTYTVSFGRSIEGCTITSGAASNEGPRIALVAVGVDSPTTLRVFTRSGANVVSDQPFYVQAICEA